MHRTTRGLIVMYVSMNPETYEELKTYAEECDIIRKGDAVRKVLNEWAQVRIEERNKVNVLDELLTKMRVSPPTNNPT